MDWRRGDMVWWSPDGDRAFVSIPGLVDDDNGASVVVRFMVGERVVGAWELRPRQEKFPELDQEAVLRARTQPEAGNGR